MDNKKTITIKNISNREVGIVVPEIRLSRFIKSGMSIKMPSDLLEEALSYPGVAELFNDQYLISEEDEKMEEIGAGYVTIPQSKEEKMTEKEIIELIDGGTDLDLDKLLKKSSEYRYDTIVSAALKSQNLTFSKANLIKKVTGKDVIEMKKQLN